MLISSIIGIDSRSTMDMDTTIKGFKLDKETLNKILDEIILIDLGDNVKFEIKSIENIREDDDYAGLRAHIIASFDNMPVNLKIDITTGDKITYREVTYKYNLLLENRSIEIWTYNMETIIAEKYESIIKRGILNTRVRDFYDVYIIMHLNRKNISEKMLKDAIIETSKHRNTFEIINNKEEVTENINDLRDNKNMQKLWKNYQEDYEYAKNITFDMLIDSLNDVKEIYFKN